MHEKKIAVLVKRLTNLAYWVATGKNEKEYSWHVPAMKFIGMKQLV